MIMMQMCIYSFTFVQYLFISLYIHNYTYTYIYIYILYLFIVLVHKMHVHVPSRNISRLRQLGESMTEPQASQGAEQAAHLEVGAPTEAEPKGSPGLFWAVKCLLML